MMRIPFCTFCLTAFLLALRPAAANDSVRIDSINSLATSIVFEQASQAREIATEAAQLAKASQFPLQQANALHTIGLSYHVQGDYNQAILHYEQAIALRRNTRDEAKIAGLLNNIASIYTSRADYSRALELYQESLSIKQASNDQQGAANTLNNIGIIHYENKDYDKAIAYYQQGLNLRLELELVDEAAASYGNIGLVYYDMQDFERSLEYYQQGFDLLASSKQVCNKIYLINGLGVAYYGVGDMTMAAKYSSQAYQDALGCDDKTVQATAINNLGKVNLQLGKYQEAEEQLLIAYELARNNSLNAELIDLTESLYLFYKDRGDVAKALSYYETVVAIRDSLESREVAQQITTLELTYAFQQEKDSLQFAQQKEILTYSAEVERKNVVQTFTWVVVGLLAAIVVMLVIVYRSKQKNNRELQRKNKVISEALSEKELLIREIHHRVKNNLQIISSMLNIQRKTAQQPATKEALEKAQNRVMSMAMVHDSLYGSNQLSNINSKAYLEELIETLTLALVPAHVQVSYDVHSVSLTSDQAISIGLLINELMTNAAKYAFPDTNQPGAIRVAFVVHPKHYQLVVTDDGVGFPDEKKQPSFGMQMIQSVVYSLQARMSQRHENGAHIEIEIPLHDDGTDR